jgi:hypothetical protein
VIVAVGGGPVVGAVLGIHDRFGRDVVHGVVGSGPSDCKYISQS